MNASAPNLPVERKSILMEMASRFGMDAGPFEATVRAVCLPPDKDGRQASREEFAAFLVVAREYRLNPLTREIYGFRAKNGSIIPVVGVDGWSRIINEHPQTDGIEFDDHLDGKNLTAITARIWRKDRGKPTTVTEYMDECRRDPDKSPWGKWPRRMLRHKALIQAARYAFGFSGIVDPDEAERMGADVSPMRNIAPKINGDGGPPPPPPRPAIAKPPAPKPEPAIDAATGEILDAIESGRTEPGEVIWEDEPQVATAADIFDGAAWLKELERAYASCNDVDDALNVTKELYLPNISKAFPPDRQRAGELRQEHYTRVQSAA